MVSEVDGDSEWTDADVGGEPETRLAVSSVLLAIDLIEGAVGAGIGVASESGCAAAVWGRLFRSEPTTKDLTNPANMVHTQHSRSQIHDGVCVGWERGGLGCQWLVVPLNWRGKMGVDAGHADGEK